MRSAGSADILLVLDTEHSSAILGNRKPRSGTSASQLLVSSEGFPASVQTFFGAPAHFLCSVSSSPWRPHCPPFLSSSDPSSEATLITALNYTLPPLTKWIRSTVTSSSSKDTRPPSLQPASLSVTSPKTHVYVHTCIMQPRYKYSCLPCLYAARRNMS